MKESWILIVVALGMCAAIIWFVKSVHDRREQHAKELRVRDLYQTSLDGTQTAIVAHDIETGEIFYINELVREIYEVEEDIKNLSSESRLMKERGKKHLDLDYSALRIGACNEEIEYHDSGRIYQVKGKIIDWNGREAYLEYLTDVTDS